MGSEAKNILILERDEGVAETVRTMAEVLGYDTQVCASTDGALTELSRKRYDVVITNRTLKHAEVSLPWLIRSVQPEARIVVTTSLRFPLAPAIPVDGLLQKPFGLHDLRDAIDAPAGA